MGTIRSVFSAGKTNKTTVLKLFIWEPANTRRRGDESLFRRSVKHLKSIVQEVTVRWAEMEALGETGGADTSEKSER